ncbi:MAG: hypothetical protein KatS3mg035_2260 [Bacteroidia bacterium]|nr:MAG: hypothetical protein KatS3mg035_2260 [Bacteroidia bacterium]
MRIQWTDYGKVKEIDTLIQSNPSAILPKLIFKYDATGNRLEKEYVLHYKDIYLRDPQGNVMAVYRIRKDSLFLTELPMYGEKRLGVIKENRFLMKKPTQNGIATSVMVTAGKPPVKTSIYTLGKKHYETTDWLGNVRVTYTDKKSWNNGKFALNVSSSQDYYPFGSVMEGRALEITNYRFGFQGQEGDDEIFGKNNLWAYKFRLHDARLGRFFSVDPLADKYPFYSFYQFSGNRVIDMVELEGKEPKSIVFYDPITNTYKFTKPTIHLLSIVSNVPEDRIASIKLIPRSNFLKPPYYSINKDGSGGGAITIYDRIVFTENFFKGKYSTRLGIMPWLYISSHEVGHLPQSDEYPHNFFGMLTYMSSFLLDYAEKYFETFDFNKAHDDVKREKEAEKGTIKLKEFNDFVEKKYGRDALIRLFDNEKLTDEQKIKKIDLWYKEFLKQSEKKSDKKS